MSAEFGNKEVIVSSGMVETKIRLQLGGGEVRSRDGKCRKTFKKLNSEREE